jgi:hypothetical protein
MATHDHRQRFPDGMLRTFAAPCTERHRAESELDPTKTPASFDFAEVPSQFRDNSRRRHELVGPLTRALNRAL